MPLPVTKQELADWILRRLGAPVVNVEIADVQLEDVIDEAVQFFQEFHYDGAERTFRTIKIEGDVLNGNNRMHQGANAPMYDATYTKYRLGDRTMTYKSNGMPDKIWVRYDSEEFVFFRYYNGDSEGILFVYDSDLLFRDEMAIVDENARDHIDSDGVYHVYDSDTHNIVIFDPLVSDSDMFYQLISGAPDSDNFVIDSEGRVVPYDSDEHAIFKYDSDAAGIWVDSDGTWVLFNAGNDDHYVNSLYRLHDSDSDSVRYVLDSDGNYVVYDAVVHDSITFVQDSEGNYVREEGTNRYVLDTTDSVYNRPDVIKFLRVVNKPVFYEVYPGQVQRFSRQFTPPPAYVLTFRDTYVDSDGGYVLYDSDKHFTWTPDSDGGFTVDSEGNFVPYDSDRDQVFMFDSDSEGLWTDSDSEFILYDSDRYRYITYDSDSEGGFVDSDGVYVVFDSDKHDPLQRVKKVTEILPEFLVTRYESDNAGFLVDSDGTFVTFNSTKYAFYSYDSETIKLDSDGNPTGRVPDSEGDLEGLYVRFILDKDSEVYELYDSDKHIGIFYDSDGSGNQGNFNIKLDRLFRYNVTIRSPQRFTAVRTFTRQRFTKEQRTKTRYEKVWDRQHYYRSTVSLGQRFSFNTVKQERRPEGYGFTELWKEENLVLTEPVIDYDYSKVGQVGIPIPDTILGVNKIFRIDNFSGMGMWNYEYQYFLNNFDFFYGNGGSSSMAMTNYYTTKSYLDLIDNMMNVQPAIRFNKHRNRLYIDTNWTRLKNMAKSKDYYLMMECYEVNDPEVFGDVYKDKWLKRYATSLAKMQWGSNMKKYTNTELPGGLMVDGQSLYEEGKEEADKLEEELRNTQLEMDFLIG